MIVPAGALAAPPAVGSELVSSTYGVRPNSVPFFGYVPLAGPVLAGPRVVWAAQDSFGAWRIGDAPLRGATSPAGSVRYAPGLGPSELNLTASSTRVAVGDQVLRCARANCVYPSVVRDRLATWRYGGTVQTLESCPGKSCQTFRTCAGDYPRWPPALIDDTLAYFDTCSPDEIILRNLSPGADHVPRRIPTGYLIFVRGAGRFLAYGDGYTTVVYDRVAGRESYRVDNVYGGDVQADGKSAFQMYDGDSVLSWASPTHPQPRVLLDPITPGSSIRIVRNLVAIEEPGAEVNTATGLITREARIRVLRLDGSRVASARVNSLIGDFDFDGKRVTFATQPCQTTGIVVWAIKDRKPPMQSPAPCPAARVRALYRRRESLHLKLGCPARPTLGCVGRVHLVLYAGARFFPLGRQSYSIPYGHSVPLTVRLPRGADRFLARHRAARVFAVTASSPWGHGSEYRFFRLSLRPGRR
ncbi:MAG: hypothetical protein JOZ25_04985 [Actinobacteria bacterium]|nr:hypothetical protein [Actinomycetota bacterium]